MKKDSSGINHKSENNDYRFTERIYRALRKEYGPVRCPLTYSKPHELAIAVMLSARCTDRQVNLVTPQLFERFLEPSDYYRAPAGEIERLIYSTGFYRNKGAGIRGFCKMLDEKYEGVIPSDAKLLERMPGIGRKSANVIVQELYGIPSGVVVDTHVIRLSGILGLSVEKNPVKIERDLIGRIRKDRWIEWSLYMIVLGRSRCQARKRDCPNCPLKKICPSSSVAKGRATAL